MKILLADDSYIMRRMQVNLLKELGCDEVVEVDCGEDVLTELKKQRDFDIILLDWNMPLMNGLDCLKAIKSNPDTRSIPVVMVTAEAQMSRVKEARQCGVDNYLLKPFEASRLKAVIEGCLASRPAGPEL